MTKKIFISFATKDRQTALTICQALEGRGQPCWISCRDIAPGANYQESIVHAIRGAAAMLLVFSANANNSDEIKKEIALASQSKLMVIPVRCEDVVPSEAFSYELATRQWVDLFANWDQAMIELVAQLHVINPPSDHTPRPPPIPAPSPIIRTTPPPPAPKSSTWLWVIVGVLVLIAGAINPYNNDMSGVVGLAAIMVGIYAWRRSKS